MSSSQSVGFGFYSIVPLGPARKNLHSEMSISLFPNKILTQSKKEKRSLWASKRDLQTF